MKTIEEMRAIEEMKTKNIRFKRRIVDAWEALPKEEREPRSLLALCKEHEISYNTAVNWRRKKVLNTTGALKTESPESEEDAVLKNLAHLDTNDPQAVLNSLWQMCVNGNNSAACERWFREKRAKEQEHKAGVELGISADEIAKRDMEAERQLREWSNRNQGSEGTGEGKVSEELPLLSS